MTTTPIEVDGQGMGHVPHLIPYSVAYSYLLTLLTGQARLRETKALVATAVCESRRRRLEDSRRSWHWRDDGRPVDVTILRSAA